MLRSSARGAIVSGGERGHRARTAVPVVEGGIPQRGGKATGDSVVGQIHLAQARVRGEPVRGGPGQPVRLERERAKQRQIAKLARDGGPRACSPETNLRELRGVRQRRGHRSRQTITGEVQPREVHRGPERGWDGPRERVGSKPQRNAKRGISPNLAGTVPRRRLCDA